jgi:two-component system, NtrC family, response regulator AtoC
MQAILLRVLQDGKIRPVGANHENTVDVRVVVATHRDLQKAVAAGTFREDLYFRLETFLLTIPPLRNRKEDLDLLAIRFLSQYNRELGKNVRGFSSDALDLLRNYSFPGNVRELQNVIKRAATFCQEGAVRAEDLPERLRGVSSLQTARDDSAFSLPPSLLDDKRVTPLEELKLRYVQHVLDQCAGNKRRAAALLGIGRRTLYEYLKKLGLPETGKSD